jgi:hypothetical protein
MSRNDAEAAAVDGLVQQEMCFDFRHIKPSQLRSRSPFFRGKITQKTQRKADPDVPSAIHQGRFVRRSAAVSRGLARLVAAATN